MSPDQHLIIDLADRSYPVLIGSGNLNQAGVLSPWLGRGATLVVTDTNVGPLYLKAAEAALGETNIHHLVLPPGEDQKCVATWQQIHQALIDAGAQRDANVVALGGGVVGDLAGFAAATYMRGINFLQIPTTLLAQVDSSVGGKTGINLTAGKNLVGAFYQPRAVLIDLTTLTTLPPREFRAGLAEVIKYALIGDAEFLTWLEARSAELTALDQAALTHAVETSVKHKAAVVAADEKEQGQRALLNLGHTFGHAVETASGYGRVLHGEAVAMGMVCAAHLSTELGMLAAGSQQRVAALLDKVGLPTQLPVEHSPARLLELMALDKKNQAGKLRLVLLEALGQACLRDDVAADQILRTLQHRMPPPS